MLKRVFLSIVAASYIFASTAAQAQSLSFIRDAEIEALLEDMAHPLYEAAGINPDIADVHVIANPAINAFVAIGSDMYIFTGLIANADVPNEVIGVMAHEVGHVAAGHSLARDDAFRAATTPMILSFLLGAAAAAAGSPELAIGLIGGGQVAAQATVLRYSRTNESEADIHAIRYLDATGQSGKGIINFFQKSRVLQTVVDYQVPVWVRTHPMASDRVELLSQRAKQSPYYDAVDPPELQRRFDMAKAKIYGFLYPAQTTFAFYPETDDSAPARYARAIAYYQSTRHQLDNALEELDWLIAQEPENPHFRELHGQMLFEHGRIDESIEPHSKSVELSPTEPLFKVNLSARHARHRRSASDRRSDRSVERSRAAGTRKQFRMVANGCRLQPKT